MLLRSSSTPLLGSLLPCSAVNGEGYYHDSDYDHPKWHMNPSACAAHFHSYASPTSHLASVSDDTRSLDGVSWDFDDSSNRSASFRKVQSETDLSSLGRGSSSPAALIAAESLVKEEFMPSSKPPKHWSRRYKGFHKMQTIPSFHGSSKNEDDDDYDEAKDVESVQRSNAAFESYLNKMEKESFNQYQSGDVSRKNETVTGYSYGEASTAKRGLTSNKDELQGESCLFMARGIGIDTLEAPTDVGGGGGRDKSSKNMGTGGGGDGTKGFGDVEQYYQKMLKENPGNSLILRNYAQFLHETKRDFSKAEDMYSRAILADPGDGEVLAKYAKLVWEYRRDADKAQSYFERAVKASTEDCDVHAAYASFLWESEEDEEEEEYSFYEHNGNYQHNGNYHMKSVSA